MTKEVIPTHDNIENYEGLYSVTPEGSVYSVKSKRYLMTGVNNLGYELVNLYANGRSKTHRVHRLVAKAYIPNPEGLPEVNHKDGDKLNNDVTNLEWCDRSHNQQHAFNMRVSRTGFKNLVRWNPRLNSFQAFTRVNGEEIYLGKYSTRKDAETAQYGAQKVVLKTVGNA
jgi:hypothetical protein